MGKGGEDGVWSVNRGKGSVNNNKTVGLRQWVLGNMKREGRREGQMENVGWVRG